jgi:hypothetical protein
MNKYYLESRRGRISYMRSTIKTRKAIWIGHTSRRNCLLKLVIEGKIEGRIEVKGKRGRRRKQLLDEFREKRGYWRLRDETFDRTVWDFGGGYGPV